MRLASKKKTSFDDTLCEVVSYLVIEKGLDLQSIRVLEVDAFMVLLDFLARQQEELKKNSKKKK
jgi:hypothetical protein